MAQGVVKWFSMEKGYGFIEPQETGNESDIFVHLTAVERSGYKELEKGQKVQFILEDQAQKKRKNVVSIEIVES